MKISLKLLLVICLVNSFASIAQTDADASRYSGGSIAGTSRFIAMSGAFGALGGDFTTMSYNPAGIAIYRTSEFTFTPSIFVGSTTSTFINQSSKDNKYNFNIGNAGLVFTRKLSNDETSEGWKSWNFGFGYNRLNNFHNRSSYEALNTSNSLLDNFAETADGHIADDLDPFYESIAYNAFLLNHDTNYHYTSVIPNGGEIQTLNSETRGGVGETVFTFGGNYSNRLYIGATLGFKNLRYINSSTYEESDPDTAIPYFDRFVFQQDVTTRGNGFNFKTGLIYKVSDYFRFGLSVETPTWYSMHDEYKNSMIGYLDTGLVKSYPSESPDGIYDYDLTTPFKAMGSIAVIFGGKGLISADYEFKDHSEARFYANGASFSNINNLIRKKYSETHTVRIGTEWIYNSISFRGGAAVVTSPLTSGYKAGSYDFSKKSLSAGIGLRQGNMFFDFGYVYTVGNEFSQPYTLTDKAVPGVKSKVVQSNFTFTFGTKF